VGLIDTIRAWASGCRAGWNRSGSPPRESAWGTSSAAWPPATLAGSHWQSVPADSTFWFLFDGVADPPAAGIAGRVAAGAGLPGGTEVLKMRGGIRVGPRFCSGPAPPSCGKRLEARARRRRKRRDKERARPSPGKAPRQRACFYYPLTKRISFQKHVSQTEGRGLTRCPVKGYNMQHDSGQRNGNPGSTFKIPVRIMT